MVGTHQRHRSSGAPFALLSAAAALVLGACGGATSGPSGTTAAPPSISEAGWRALATPRPAPLPDAPRVSVGAVEILANSDLGLTSESGPAPAVSALVVVGLLRRQDVHFVERRRFAAAAEAERRGQTRPEGAPAVGVSVQPEFILDASWASVGLDSAYLDVHLKDAQSGAVVGKHRLATPNGVDPTSLARTVVGSLLVILDDMGRRPAWNDPLPASAPASYRPTGIPATAVDAFFGGLRAEDGWQWDRARVGYQAALKAGGPSFVEAETALARTARLRLGGTLGAS